MTSWVRSSFCAGGDCIEVRANGSKVAVRLTAKPGYVRPDFLLADRAEWDAFVAGVKAGDFDNLQETP